MKYIITESQRYVLLMETLSPKFRRRLTFDNMVEEMESIIEYQLEPCSFGNVSVFVAEACDMFVYSFFEEQGFDKSDVVRIKNFLKKNSFQYAFGEYIKKI